MVVANGCAFITVVDPAYPATLAAKSGPNTIRHRTYRLWPTGGIASLAVPELGRIFAGPESSIIAKTHLAAARPILPRPRHSAEKGQNTASTF